MTLITLSLIGASYVGGLWDSTGAPTQSPAMAEYVRVKPECGGKQRAKVKWRKGYRVKTFVVECPSGVIYLQWSRPRIDPQYRKTLLTR